MPYIKPAKHGELISAAEYNKVVAAATRHTSGVNAFQDETGTYIRKPASGSPVFYAEITDFDTTPHKKHAWKEKIWDESEAEWIDMPSGRTGDLAAGGDPDKDVAFEISGIRAVPMQTIVEMNVIQGDDGGAVYIFQYTGCWWGKVMYSGWSIQSNRCRGNRFNCGRVWWMGL